MTSNNQTFEYDGQCAFAVSTGKTGVAGGKHPVTVNGRTFSFSNPIAKLLFKVLPNRAGKADAVWAKEQ